ncbi:MAG TPA: MFS transporter [Candidatus Dormibacteraeota bacterium]|nr:MFS transporter [Candidatus Dormibacteraeota bacterium]
MSASSPRVSSWAPLRIGVFRAIWLAVLVSNVATWMQTVGAQWLLVNQPHASILVALVQTADYLPDVLFGVVGGVLADTFDRRRLLMAVEGFLVIAGAALAALTFTGQMPPALLLTFTFLIGFGSVVTLPAYQSLVPDLVPRAQLHSAAALASISVNVARAAGPAIAGIVIARAGVGAVFALNTAMYLLFLVVLIAWRPPAGSMPKVPERFISALRAGGRYVRYAPVVRRILLRSTLFLVPASALWALLPLIASQRLAQGADGYGFLLGALGVGAIAGALVLPRVRMKLSLNALMAASGIVYAVVLAAVVLVSNAVVILIVLLPAGVAWMAVLSTINGELQLFLPAWVRGRGLSVYQTVLFGAQGFGALMWGVIAAPAGIVPTFLIAAAVMLIGVATMRFWPLIDTAGMDRSTVRYWREPNLAIDADPDDGPVVVQSVYTVAPEKEEPFLRAMARVRLSRLRTGATQWGLFRDGETPRKFVELYVVPSWEEHLRQHVDRLTGTDQQYEEAAAAFSDLPEETSHLIAVELPDYDA